MGTVLSPQRLKIILRGAVQGVGFRPFVAGLAAELGLKGQVSNFSGGVVIEAEGLPEKLETFLVQLSRDKPSRAFIQSLESSILDPSGFTDFKIVPSDTASQKSAWIMPDIATCPECIADIFDPTNRRYLYPFTNCTQCGPRYSIVTALPYDRVHTTMQGFVMCDLCQAEYENPKDRRYHAQANACAKCGPKLEGWNTSGDLLNEGGLALFGAVNALKEGKIVAVKGLGGFHLMVDATSEEAVRLLRERKHRDGKPLALMMPSLAAAEEVCEISGMEARALMSAEAPIVILQKKKTSKPWDFLIARSVAPHHPTWGVMLPYTPLHHLIMKQMECPIVATSGNLSEETLATDNREALARLYGIADHFLVHDRPIARHVDDSIVRVVMDRTLILRRARGYAPLPVMLAESLPTILALGAHLKNTIAQNCEDQVFVSQHIGDLESVESYQTFERTLHTFEGLYEKKQEFIACDMHPDYGSTRYALSSDKPTVRVQHHYAHILSCMAENEVKAPVLGIAWDGAGLGADGTIWGGEFLRVDEKYYSRVASLRPFCLPGADKAAQEPRRSLLGLFYEMYGEALFGGCYPEKLMNFSKEEIRTLQGMFSSDIQCPRTTSAGRLFDAMASLLGIRQKHRYEGQAAMELEFAAERCITDESFEVCIKPVKDRGPLRWEFDWEPMFRSAWESWQAERPTELIAAQFHNTLVECMVRMAQKVGESKIVLSGGCFQNKYLLERSVRRLRDEGFQVYWHQRIPPNDGGISLGQIVAASRAIQKDPSASFCAESERGLSCV